MAGQFRLTALDLIEVSLVERGDDPEARIVFSKGEQCGRTHKAGRTCTSCGAVSKSAPDGKELNVPQPLDEKDFKHAKRTKKPKQKELLRANGVIE